MAEADPSGFPDPAAETEPYLKGSFTIGKVLYDVSLSSTKFSWIKRGGTTDKPNSVPIEEILSVSKLTGRAHGEAVVAVGFTVIFVEHKKNYILQQATVQFLGSSEDGEVWTRKIEEALEKVKERPHRVLVLINPVSGNGHAKKIYNQTVAEIFKTAHVETDVIVTEKAHHSEEILSDYDLTAIDGQCDLDIPREKMAKLFVNSEDPEQTPHFVASDLDLQCLPVTLFIVLVSGDGLFHEVTNGLQHRMMKEAGLNENDASIDLKPIPIPIALIPAGTGNGIAYACFGNKDVVSAALSTVIGKKRYNPLMTVHCQEELLVYSSLMVGAGYWSDMIYYAETRRHLGKLRHLVCLIEVILIRAYRHMDLTVDTLPPRPKPEIQDKDGPHHHSPVDTEGVVSSGTGWESRNGTYIGAIVFLGDMFSPKDAVEKEEAVTLLLNKPCGRMDLIRCMKGFFTLDSAMLESDLIEHMNVKEYKLKLNKVSDLETEMGKKEHTLYVDGEIYHVKHPEIHCRLHPKTVQLYCTDTKISFFKT